MTPRTRTLLTILLLSAVLLGCAPRPPSWPPFPEKLEETSTWYVNAERYQVSAHGTVACEDCHPEILPGSAAEPHPDPDKLTLDATSLFDYEMCEPCHPQEYAAYEQGVHAEAAARPQELQSQTPIPTCGHCHNTHYGTAKTRAELLASVPEMCGRECHPNALETYEHNYHGKAAQLSYEKTATCTDCHGAHHVLALYDSGEAMAACRRCHPYTNASLVSYRIHAHETLDPDPDDPRAGDFRLFFWIKLFFTLLLVSVLGFFYIHTALWFLRSLHKRLRGGRHG